MLVWKPKESEALGFLGSAKFKEVEGVVVGLRRVQEMEREWPCGLLGC